MCFAFQDGCLTFIGSRSNWTLHQRGSRDGLARLTFGAFYSRWAPWSRGTRLTRHSEITFYPHCSSRTSWSMFPRGSFRPGSPWGARSPSGYGSPNKCDTTHNRQQQARHGIQAAESVCTLLFLVMFHCCRDCHGEVCKRNIFRELFCLLCRPSD